MAITAEKFAQMVQRIAPLSCAYDWDNSGMTLHIHDEVKKVFVCLDVTEDTLKEAREAGCDTILSHHPLLFSAQKKFDKEEPVSSLFLQAVGAGINLYAAHTSYDCAPGGMNDQLAALLGLVKLRPLVVQGEDEKGAVTSVAGTVGEYEAALDLAAFAKRVKEGLKLPVVRIAYGGKEIKKVACMGGAGCEFLMDAATAGADAFLTGEVKHNYFAEARALGVTLVEAGHYDTEKIFVSAMCDSLQNIKNELQCSIEVICSLHEKRPYEFC